MRNPKRIPEILKKLEEVWSKEGTNDLRLGQLIAICTNRFYGNKGVFDSFSIEDEDLMKQLDKFGKVK